MKQFSIILFLAITLTSVPSQAWWQPETGLTWDIQLTGELDLDTEAQAVVVDLFDTPTTNIANLQDQGQYVICYFSAGSFGNWRPDRKKFPASVKGKSNGWADEKWLDIRQTKILKPIMQARINLASQKGCDAVDPDNVDGYTNKTGFKLTSTHQKTYNIMLAKMAHAKGLAIGLKNNLEQAELLEPYFDFAVNESCDEYNECDMLLPFIDAGKPVLAIDYQDNPSVCDLGNNLEFSMILKDDLLSERGVGCWTQD